MFLLYIDEDSGDRNLVQALRARGVDVVTAQEVGMIERSDEEHLQYMALRSSADMRNCVEFLSAWG